MRGKRGFSPTLSLSYDFGYGPPIDLRAWPSPYRLLPGLVLCLGTLHPSNDFGHSPHIDLRAFKVILAPMFTFCLFVSFFIFWLGHTLFCLLKYCLSVSFCC